MAGCAFPEITTSSILLLHSYFICTIFRTCQSTIFTPYIHIEKALFTSFCSRYIYFFVFHSILCRTISIHTCYPDIISARFFTYFTFHKIISLLIFCSYSHIDYFRFHFLSSPIHSSFYKWSLQYHLRHLSPSYTLFHL